MNFSAMQSHMNFLYIVFNLDQITLLHCQRFKLCMNFSVMQSHVELKQLIVYTWGKAHIMYVNIYIMRHVLMSCGCIKVTMLHCQRFKLCINFSVMQSHMKLKTAHCIYVHSGRLTLCMCKCLDDDTSCLM